MAAPPDSFETFFDEHYESVFRILAVAFREPLLAEEATRQAFARGYDAVASASAAWNGPRRGFT